MPGVPGLRDVRSGRWKSSAAEGGLAIGFTVGTSDARLILLLREKQRPAVGLDNLFALGLIALCYGAALLPWDYGFLAVFAAWFVMRCLERQRV